MQFSGHCRGNKNLWLLIDILNKDVKSKACFSESDIFRNTDTAKDTLCVMCQCHPGSSLTETIFPHPTLYLLEEQLRSCWLLYITIWAQGEFSDNPTILHPVFALSWLRNLSLFSLLFCPASTLLTILPLLQYWWAVFSFFAIWPLFNELLDEKIFIWEHMLNLFYSSSLGRLWVLLVHSAVSHPSSTVPFASLSQDTGLCSSPKVIEKKSYLSR